MRIFAGSVQAGLWIRLLLMVAIGGPALGLAQTPAADLRRIPDRAAVQRAVAPILPVEVLMQGQGGRVDARVRIAADGTLRDVLSITTSPSSPALEQAVRAVLPRWRFRVEVDDNCQPLPYEAGVGLTVEISKGKPRTRVERAGEIRRLSGAPELKLNRPVMRTELRSRFPVAARQQGIGASVLLAVEVNGVTGAPDKVSVVVVELLDGAESPALEAAFADAAREAMKTAQFVVSTGTVKTPLTYCGEIRFQLEE